jgi:hypothetical protein
MFTDSKEDRPCTGTRASKVKAGERPSEARQISPSQHTGLQAIVKGLTKAASVVSGHYPAMQSYIPALPS